MSSGHADGSASLGWSARLELGFKQGPQRTVLARRHHRGPLMVQRPFYPEGAVCHTYLLHPPAGVVGGDQLQIRVNVGNGAKALVTTPGATKLYRSAGRHARLLQELWVAENAALEWLPQEVIAFPGARAALTTRITLSGAARVAAWDIQCFGLTATQQRFDSGELDLRFELWRDEVPVLLERLQVTPERLDQDAALRSHPVTGTFIIGPAGTPERDLTHSLLPGSGPHLCGITLLDDYLVIRYLGPSAAHAQELFQRLWAALRPGIFGLPACPPRIWAT